MTPNYLKKVLPLLLDADLAGATNPRLLSLARAYAALYNLVSGGATAGEYGTVEAYRRRIGLLSDLLLARCREESDVATRSRMIHAAYVLVCETSFVVDLKKKERCYAAADALVRNYIQEVSLQSGGNLLQQTGICLCMTDLLYPYPDAGDEYLLLLGHVVDGWVAGLDGNGRWPGVSSDVALERIGVMDRYSCLFPDRGNVGVIKRVAGYYRTCVPVPEDPRNFDENYLYTLGRMYDALTLGDMWRAGKPAARRIARFMYEYSRTLPCWDDAWFYCLSYIVHNIADGIEARLEAEMERHIA